MGSANLTRAETADRAAAVAVTAYRVELDLSGAPDPTRLGFPTTTTVEFTSSAPQTWLDFLGEVESVTINGSEVPVVHDGARIALTGLVERNVVTVRATGRYSRSGEGLHRFTDPVDGQTYLYTQYEPADARRVFACFEQPDLKAPFVFEVTVPERWLVCSNRSVAQRSVSAANQTVVFAPTVPIATYITAVVADRITGSNPYGAVTIWWCRSA